VRNHEDVNSLLTLEEVLQGYPQRGDRVACTSLMLPVRFSQVAFKNDTLYIGNLHAHEADRERCFNRFCKED
jgi:hypothetical protein